MQYRFQKGHPFYKGNEKQGFQKGNKGFRTKESYQEAGLKISQALKEKPKSKDHIEHLKKSHKGQKAWNKNKKTPEEVKEKIKKTLTGRELTEAHRINIGLGQTGEKHWNWQNGISFEPYSSDWTEALKKSIRERDNYICQLSGKYGNCVHHIDYDKKNCSSINLITLSVSYNSIVNSKRDYWTNYFKQRQSV